MKERKGKMKEGMQLKQKIVWTVFRLDRGKVWDGMTEKSDLP